MAKLTVARVPGQVRLGCPGLHATFHIRRWRQTLATEHLFAFRWLMIKEGYTHIVMKQYHGCQQIGRGDGRLYHPGKKGLTLPL